MALWRCTVASGEEEEAEQQAINSSPSHLVQMHEGGTGRRVAGLISFCLWRLEKVR
jgi:hypothetical protein